MEPQSFVQLLDKAPISDEVITLSLCPTMDLIALLSPSTLTIYRLNWNRLLSLATTASVVCWSSDGKSMFLAEGDQITELDLEQRQPVQQQRARVLAGDRYAVIALCSLGADLRTIANEGSPNAGGGGGVAHFFAPTTGVVAHMNHHHQPKRQEVLNVSRLSLIVYMDNTCALQVTGHDLLPILGPFPIPNVQQTLGVFASDTSSLWAGILTETEIQVLRFDVSVLHDCGPDLARVLSQHTNISALFTDLEVSMKEAGKRWHEVVKLVVGPVAQLNERLEQNTELEEMHDSLLNDMLLRVLLSGSNHPAVDMWTQWDLKERATMNLVAKVKAGCDTARDALRKGQQLVEVICFRVNEIRGLTRWDRFAPLLGNCDVSTETLWTQSKRLAQSIAACQETLAGERIPIEAFACWLSRASLRHQLAETSRNPHLQEEYARNELLAKLADHTKAHAFRETHVGAFIRRATATSYEEPLTDMLRRTESLEARETSEEVFHEIRGTLNSSVSFEVVYRLPREQEEPPLMKVSQNSVALIQDSQVIFLSFDQANLSVNMFDCGAFIVAADFYKDGKFVVMSEEGEEDTRLSLLDDTRQRVERSRLLEGFAAERMCVSAQRGLCAVYGGRRLLAFDLEGDEQEESSTEESSSE